MELTEIKKYKDDECIGNLVKDFFEYCNIDINKELSNDELDDLFLDCCNSEYYNRLDKQHSIENRIELLELLTKAERHYNMEVNPYDGKEFYINFDNYGTEIEINDISELDKIDYEDYDPIILSVWVKADDDYVDFAVEYGKLYKMGDTYGETDFYQSFYCLPIDYVVRGLRESLKNNPDDFDLEYFPKKYHVTWC